MNILTTDGLVKKYKNHVVVDNVNMHVEQGDIYGFVGENGAGKTTVIRIITGLARPTEGTYSLYGMDYKDKQISTQRRKTSAIVEAVSLSGGMTALENLRIQCLLSDVNKTDEELIDLINLVGLDYESIKDKKVKNFSLGMRQRIGIALVMASDPDFIILDEPLNGLDPQGFIDVRETILKLAKEKGVTFLISSHVLAELDKICNKVGFISHGKLLKEISIDELHDRARERVEIVLKDKDTIDDFSNLLKEKLSLKDVRLEENKLIVFDKVEMNDLVKTIYESKISVDEINVLRETIEDYYMSVLGGEK